MIIGILAVAALVALGVMAWVVVPKLSLLSSLQIEESPRERWRRLKKHIVISRMIRKVKEQSTELEKRIFNKERRARFRFRIESAIAKLRKLEENYREQTKDHKIVMLLKKAAEQLEDNSESAEEKFLEVVRLDPHNLEAYEGLLQIYLTRKKLAEASEIVDFLKKINPASVGRYSFDLAKLLLEGGEFKKARKYGEQALKDEPENPKYLDFLIEVAILGGKRGEAQQHVDRLREVNPENAKIVEFESRIGALN
ncbi:hypothetical protein HYW17_00980 [Candidatus Uhrbacteria bacterium]|nr:hypothetical protein [Candidatus Uhrbacteria bacterium]